MQSSGVSDRNISAQKTHNLSTKFGAMIFVCTHQVRKLVQQQQLVWFLAAHSNAPIGAYCQTLQVA
jgi:hypothetical protein